MIRALLAAAAAALAAPSLAQAPPFAADLELTMTGEAAAQLKQLAKQTGQEIPMSHPGRVAISGTKLRWELSAGPQPVVLLNDFSESGKSYLLHPAQKTYTELSRTERTEEGSNPDDLARFLRDGGDVCKMSHELQSCRKLGIEKVSGRSCQEYETVAASGERETFCVDEKLHFPLRIVSAQTTTVLQNVVEGPQPASLFAIPAGYVKQGQ